MGDPAGRGSWTDAELELALRDVAASLAVPSVAPSTGAVAAATALDPARRARLRIEAGVRPGSERRRWPWLAPRPRLRLGRGLVLALIALVIVAAVAGAIGLGVPGIRIVTAPTASPLASATGSTPPSTPSPTGSSATPRPSGPAALGLDLGLGDSIAVGDAAAAVDIPLVFPTAPGVGAPSSAWLREDRLSFVWPASAALPATREPGIGLILSEFRGSVEPDYFQKVIGPGTTITTVRIGDVTGYWISGAPHELVFVNRYGDPVFDSRRIVGDTLLWARGDVTFRLESGLNRAAAVALAESLR